MKKATVFRCYLAGSFSPYGKYPDWRDAVIAGCTDAAIDFYDPRRHTPQGSISTFVSGDCRGVDGCKVLFCFNPDLGGAAEMGRADALGMLVLLCVDAEKEKMPHPYLVGISRRVLIGMDNGIAYLCALAKHGIANEFQAAYDMLT